MKTSQPTYSQLTLQPSLVRNASLAVGFFLGIVCLATSSLVAQTLMQFDFNEGTGTTAKSDDGQLTGSFVGTPTFSSDTPSGLEGDYSMEFAAGQRITVPDPNEILALDPANPNFTIEAWLKFTTPGARAVYFY